MPNPENTALRYILSWALVILAAAAFGTLIAMGASCTAEQGALAKQETTAVGAKVEQCLTQALADEIGSIVLARTVMSTQPAAAPAPQPQPQTILVPVLPSLPHEHNTNTLDGGAL
jgi:hypothetical protein